MIIYDGKIEFLLLNLDYPRESLILHISYLSDKIRAYNLTYFDDNKLYIPHALYKVIRARRADLKKQL